jgi:hypothetical protein
MPVGSDRMAANRDVPNLLGRPVRRCGPYRQRLAFPLVRRLGRRQVGLRRHIAGAANAIGGRAGRWSSMIEAWTVGASGT